MFVTNAKSVRSQLAPEVFTSSTVNAFFCYLEGGLETQKRTEAREKFLHTFNSLGMGLKAYRNKAEMKKRKKCTQHMCCAFLQMSSSLVAFFISALFSIPWSFTETLISLVFLLWKSQVIAFLHSQAHPNWSYHLHQLPQLNMWHIWCSACWARTHSLTHHNLQHSLSTLGVRPVEHAPIP